MVKKAQTFNDYDSLQKMLKSNDPKIQKKLGKKVKDFNDEKWDGLKYQIMIDGLTLKFSQNIDLKEKLLSTGNKILVEGSPSDKIWGVGLKYDDPRILNESLWNGQNLLGKALMQVRKSLK